MPDSTPELRRHRTAGDNGHPGGSPGKRGGIFPWFSLLTETTMEHANVPHGFVRLRLAEQVLDTADGQQVAFVSDAASVLHEVLDVPGCLNRLVEACHALGS